jgi:hypothetical protein
MISAVPWRWVEESAQFVAEVAEPRRTLTIRWDEGDQGWFLAVIDPGRPAQMGQPAVGSRTFVTPMPLLVALTLLPEEHHEQLIGRARRALHELRDSHVLANVHTAVAALPMGWPDLIGAREALEAAAREMPDVERLSLDMAAGGAWT